MLYICVILSVELLQFIHSSAVVNMFVRFAACALIYTDPPVSYIAKMHDIAALLHIP